MRRGHRIRPSMLSIIRITFLICWSGIAFTQPADSLYQLARQAFTDRNFDQAYQTYEQAGQAFLVSEEWTRYLQCRVEMARCSQFTSSVSRQAIQQILDPAMDLMEKHPSVQQSVEAIQCHQFLARYYWAIEGNYASAIESYQKSLDLAETLGDTARYYRMSSLADLSHVYSNQEEFDQALDCATSALELSREIYGDDHVENGPRYYDLGFTYYRKGYFDQAIRQIRQGIQILEENQGPEMQIGLGYNHLSAVYVAKLDHEEALQSSRAAGQILSNYLGPDHEALANIYWDLGVMYTDLEMYEPAEENLRKAAALFQTNFGPSYPQFPQLYHQLGYCYNQMGRYREAEKWHQDAYELNLMTYGPQHPRTGESYRQLANHYNSEGNVKQAGWAISKGLEIVGAAGNQSNVLRAGIFSEQARLLNHQHQYYDAVDSYDKALQAIIQPTGTGEELTSDQTFNPLYFTEFNSEKAKNLFLAFRQDQDETSLTRALSAARQAHNGIRRLRHSYQNAGSKLFMQKRAREHYDLMLDILFEFRKITQDESLLAEAWQITEQAKSLLLLEEIKAADLIFPGIPEKSIDTLRNLRKDLSQLQQRINEHLTEGDTNGLTRKQRNFFSTQNKLILFDNQLSEKYPEYKSIQNELSPGDIYEISANLLPGHVLLEYYLADTALHIFTLDRKEIHWEKKSLPSDFENRIQAVIRESRDLEKIVQSPQQALNDYRDEVRQLSHYVWPLETLNHLDAVEDIIIIPDQELGYIAFESLTSSPDEKYLIEKYTISYAYSASLYHREITRADQISRINYAGFAPDYALQDSSTIKQDLAMVQLYREGLFDLPGAQKEVGQIGTLFNGKTWLGEAATKAVFKAEAPHYSLLHLALHGIIDEQEPMRSRLLFYNGSPDDNGALNAYEIYNLDLRANLAVLSACNTASGSLQSGEGILSLSRAFAFAGIPNMVASLWRADDAASSEIMIGFYRGLAGGLTKSKALQQAKLQFIGDQKTKTYQHPYFWSSFILIGENTSTFARSSNRLWWVAGIILLIITFIYMQQRKNRV